MRDRYITMRNSKTIDFYFFFDYAISKGFNLGIEAFHIGSVHLDVIHLIEHLDREFCLTLLLDKNNNFIKVIE